MQETACWSHCMYAKVTQSCLTLCDSMDYTVNGILQARILEWVAVSSSRGSSQPRDRTQVSCIVDGFFTSWTTREAQEYWVAYPFASGSSWPRNQTGVSCIAGRFFTNWANREAVGLTGWAQFLCISAATFSPAPQLTFLLPRILTFSSFSLPL